MLFGATGFTGGLTAEYLAARADPGTRWALAGRNTAKLEDVRAAARPHQADAAELPLLRAEIADARLDPQGVAESTKVVITTVGPYILYGEPLVAACAAAGTDVRRPDRASPSSSIRCGCATTSRRERSGARLVHSCGFDSIPYDLGALFTVEQLAGGRADRARRAASCKWAERSPAAPTTRRSQIMGRLRQGQRIGA